MCKPEPVLGNCVMYINTCQKQDSHYFPPQAVLDTQEMHVQKLDMTHRETGEKPDAVTAKPSSKFILSDISCDWAQTLLPSAAE